MDVVTTGQLYWLTRCDGLKDLLHGLYGTSYFLFVIIGIAAIALLIAGMVTSNGPLDAFPRIPDEELDKIHRKFRKTARWFFVVSTFLLVSGLVMDVAHKLVPTTKELAAIIVVPRIANSQTTKELGEGVVTLAKEWLEELRPNKTEAK